MVRKVEYGITARSASGPLLLESWNFFFSTPTHTNGSPSIVTVRPIGLIPLPNSLSARSLPRNTTRRFCSTSVGLMKRPPSAGSMCRAISWSVPTPSRNVRRALPAHRNGGTPAPVRDAAAVDIRDRAHQQRQVLLHQPDAAALREPRERLARLAAIEHEDPLAGAEQPVAQRALEPLAKGQEQHDRQRAPRHRQERQHRPRCAAP